MPSSIPGALTALTSVVTTALPGVTVVDGETGAYVAHEQFTIVDVTGSDVPGAIMGGHPQMYAESYDINCRARTFAGGMDLDARRTRGLAMKDALRDGLAADQSMGNVVNQAYLSRYTLRTSYDASAKGVASEVDLTVHVDNLQI